MGEGEVVEQLSNHADTLLAGVSLIFSIVSAYVVALNYFIGSSNLAARLGSFAFVSLVLLMLLMVIMGVQTAHAGLIARLLELKAEGQLTAAGSALLANATTLAIGGHSVDGILSISAMAGLGFVYLALAYLTFIHKWTPDAIPVTIQREA